MKTIMTRTAAAAALFALSGCATLTGGDLVSGELPVGQIVVQNSTGIVINAVTISKCGAMSHGLSRLSSNLRPGQSRSWQVDSGCWDVQAGYGDSNGYQTANFSDIQVRGGRRMQLTVTGPQGGPVREF